MPKAGNPCKRGRLSTVDLLIKKGYFVKQNKIFSVLKETGVNQLVRGGQQYWVFPLSKDSLPKVSSYEEAVEPHVGSDEEDEDDEEELAVEEGDQDQRWDPATDVLGPIS